MRVLIVLHRWWGVAFCLLFAMWFASGIAMHFVPFPARTDAGHFRGLAPINSEEIAHSPAEAIAASGIHDALRVRLIGRSDQPIYLIFGPSEVKALRALDLADGGVHSDRTVLDIAIAYARDRGLDPSHAGIASPITYDQWTVSGEYDSDRPLYRVSLNDSSGTDLYVSSATGSIVVITTRHMRLLNYLGSIAHWIYPTALRHHPQAWSALLWWLALFATIGAGVGFIIGLMRLIATNRNAASPHRGLQAWHYGFGLVCAPFILSWIFSGWLSMDDGRLFSGNATRVDALAIADPTAWNQLRSDEVRRLHAGLKEIEWFAFDGRIYRRDRDMAGAHRLVQAAPEADATSYPRTFLQENEIDAAAKRLGRDCSNASVLDADDPYEVTRITSDEPVFRIVCSDIWFDIDGATGELLNRIDPSRRAYRWLFGGLHTLNFSWLRHPPWLRSILIVVLCGCGFVFSLSGVVLAWQRLRNTVAKG
ncbi:PepSY domain-containing protein [Bradyrhizobium canariense]|nr:PepSY domain-containing protein [Bradyrhizobium canariense]